eukprot:GHVH01014190.1.p1 GENE.GHVH01014190.1~~GHVH01014190.1.p1  ORF type:complete len:205 (-),score=32.75 GHVH01014190.1:94-708(-)
MLISLISGASSLKCSLPPRELISQSSLLRRSFLQTTSILSDFSEQIAAGQEANDGLSPSSADGLPEVDESEVLEMVDELISSARSEEFDQGVQFMMDFIINKNLHTGLCRRDYQASCPEGWSPADDDDLLDRRTTCVPPVTSFLSAAACSDDNQPQYTGLCGNLRIEDSDDRRDPKTIKRLENLSWHDSLPQALSTTSLLQDDR